MKLDLTLNNKINEIEFMDTKIQIRPYLLSDEINKIVEEMLKNNNYIQRIALRNMMILHFCTNLDILNENNEIDATYENYDKYKTNGLIDLVLDNIDENDLLLIDEAIYYEESTNKTLKDFLDVVTDRIDKTIKDFNSNDIMNKINEVIKNDKK